jgi:pseudouridylate synthase
MRAGVESAGATPAVIAVVRGSPTVGLTPEELDRFLRRVDILKAAARDLPTAMAKGADAATTVAGSLAICRATGLPVFATGGIGGVHREPPFDESADLIELSRSSVVVVCSGAKAILDLPATLERLETLSVTVVGFRTAELPGFFCRSSGLPLATVVDEVDKLAVVFLRQRRLGLPGALLIVQPPPADSALPRDQVDEAVRRALEEARDRRVRGAALTPFLLQRIEAATSGASLRANLGLLESNARLAGQIATALIGAGVT